MRHQRRVHPLAAFIDELADLILVVEKEDHPPFDSVEDAGFLSALHQAHAELGLELLPHRRDAAELSERSRAHLREHAVEPAADFGESVERFQQHVGADLSVFDRLAERANIHARRLRQFAQRQAGVRSWFNSWAMNRPLATTCVTAKENRFICSELAPMPADTIEIFWSVGTTLSSFVKPPASV